MKNLKRIMKIGNYRELEKFIGTDNFNGLKETFKDVNRDHNLNLLLESNETNSQITVYEYPKNSSVYIKTPSGVLVIIQVPKK